MIITNSTADKFYFEQLLAFLVSVRINSPEHSVRVFLANYPLEMENRLKEVFPEFIFENRELEMIDERGFSLILFRAAMIKECFEKYSESVAWIDTDVVVRKDLGEFLEVESEQLKILYRGDNKPENVRINAGIFNIGYSKITYDFICDWYERIKVNAVWGQGQLELWRAYKDSNVKLIEMSNKFNDLGGNDRPNAFDNASVMWHCKFGHFNNPKFQKEYQYHLKFGKELYYE